MATEGMMREMARRLEWVHEVNTAIRALSSDPHHQAVKYIEAHHMGENA